MTRKHYPQDQRPRDPVPGSGPEPEAGLSAQMLRALDESERAADAIVSEDPQKTLEYMLQDGGE